MRLVLGLLMAGSLLIGLSANATVKKLGNVVAYEKEVTNVYDNCLKNIAEDKRTPARNFICVVKVIDETRELMFSKGTALKHKTAACDVQGDLGGHSLLISFGTGTGVSTFDVASACLSDALRSADPIKAVIYTVE